VSTKFLDRRLPLRQAKADEKEAKAEAKKAEAEAKLAANRKS